MKKAFRFIAVALLVASVCGFLVMWGLLNLRAQEALRGFGWAPRLLFALPSAVVLARQARRLRSVLAGGCFCGESPWGHYAAMFLAASVLGSCILSIPGA